MSHVPDRVARRSALPRGTASWLVLFVASSVCVGAQERPAPSSPAAPSSIAATRLTFEENRGQLDPKVRFVSRSPRDTLFLTADEAVLALKGQPASRALRMRFRNGNTKSEILGIDPLSSVTYYAKAATRGRLEPTRSYQRVRYSKLYPGIDLEYYRAENHLEFDLIVAPGASPNPIELSFAGADVIAHEANGDVTIDIAGERVVLKRPIVFQEREGERESVDGRYVLSGTNVRIALGDYDVSLPLVIDPLIVYATYLGGPGDDEVIGAELGEHGDLYVFGLTNNGPAFPHTDVDPLEHTLDPINCFVSRISADGRTLLSSVLFEGFGICQAFEVEGDRVHVAMQSMLGNFGGFAQLRTLSFVPGSPVTVSPLKGIGPTQIGGPPTQIEDIRTDGFGNTYVLYHQLFGTAELQARLMKINEAGNILGTYDLDLVPEEARSARAIAVDNFGHVFVIGSTTGPITPSPDALQPARPTLFNCPENGFLIGIDTNVAPYVQTYASYIAGDGCDVALGIVRDPLDNLYVVGRTTSSSLPFAGARVTGGPGGDAFIMKIAAPPNEEVTLVTAQFLALELGSGSEGVADVFHPLVRLSGGGLAVTGGATGSSLQLINALFDATSAPGYPRFLQIFRQEDLATIVSTHLDSTGAATHAVAAAARGSGVAVAERSIFAVVQTTDAGLATTGTLQDSPAGGRDVLIRKIDIGDALTNSAPFFSLGDDRTIEAADANGADFDLSCAWCSITDLTSGIRQLIWKINGVRYVLEQPFVGQIVLPPGRLSIELTVVDTGGAATSDTVVITVAPPRANNAPTITLAPGMTVPATSPNGAEMWVLASVSDPDQEPLDLTWVVPGIVTMQSTVSPPYFSTNASSSLRLPIGAHVATLTVSDRRGQIITAQTTIVVNGINTTTAGETLSLIDDNLQTVTTFTPGRMTVMFDNVATPGLTWFRTRLDQLPPPPAVPQPMQLGSSPNYYDLGTTAGISGDVRVCIDTTGMSFVDPATIRLYRHDGTVWQDVTRTATAAETAAHMICGVVSAASGLGTFAIFTPAAEATRVTTIIGNGDPFTPGTPAPGDGGPARLAPVGVNGFAIDAARQLAYVGDGGRLRRVDLQTNTIVSIAGNFGSIADEQDGVDARNFPFSGGQLAVDRNGNIFFAGLNGCSINRIDAQTNLVRRVAGLGPDPTTLQCRYNGDGGRATQADVTWSGGLAFDADGNLFFAQMVFGAPNTGSGKSIRRIAAGPDHLITGDDPSELISTVAGGGTTWPPQSGDPRAALIDADDIAFNAQDDMYVSGTAVVVRIAPAPGSALIDGRTGELLSVVAGQALVTYAPYEGDGGPALQANFTTMRGIEILPNGDLAIAETGANRIRVVNAGPDGVVNGDASERIRTIAGFSENTWDTSLLHFNGDGYALSTAFNSPLDVAVDPRGGIYIVDAGFNRVRHVGGLTPTTELPDLAVTATATASQVAALEPFSYVVTLSNLAPRQTTATLNVVLDANVRFDGSSPAICSTTGGALTCDVGSLTSGLASEVRVQVTPIMLGTATATFVVSSQDGDSDLSNNTATVNVTSSLTIRETIVVTDGVDARPALMVVVNEAITVSDAVTPQPAVMLRVNETIVVSDAVTTAVSDQADLAIAVVPSRTLLNIGNPVSFAITVTNTGTSALGVSFSLPAPSGLVVDQINLPPLSCIVIFGIGSWTCGLGDLAPGARLEFTVDAHATSGPSGTATFSVGSTTTDPVQGNNAAVVNVAINRPPAVDAGPDREVVVTTNPAAVAVSAGVTDPDGDAITSIAWFEGATFLVNGAFTEVPLAVGTHTLTVVATDNRGGQSSDSLVLVVRPATLARPVTVLASSGAPGQATVNWAPVAGASEYRVYRDVDPVTVTQISPPLEALSSNATLVATVTDTAFQDNGLPTLVRQFYAVVAVNGAAVSQPTASPQVIVRAHPDAEIFGFADTHSHQFANLGFGRGVISGAAFSPAGIADALPSCELAHGPGGTHDAIGNFLTGSLGHDTRGFDPGANSFSGWPRFDTRTHQQMYHEWVRRAFEGGQRLMVMHAISTKVLCEVNRSPFDCEDMASIETQLLEAKRLEEYIDTRSGGPGQGWYRIAYSGNEARQIINSGRMAVVLGIEVDELFGCGRNSTCTLSNITQKLDYFHDLGVRHVFPVGHFDNAFGGAAMYNPMFNIGNFEQTGLFIQARECAPEGYRYTQRPGGEAAIWAALHLLLHPGTIPPGVPDYPFAADCNSRGLLGPGEYLVREMMERGMIIDIDHMSALAANRVLTMAEQADYPGVASGHSGPLAASMGDRASEGAKTTTQLNRINSLGGLSSVILNQGGRATTGDPHGTTSHGTMVANDCSQSTKTLAQAYLAAVDAIGGPETAAIGFGSDFNGLGGQPGPRSGPRACPGDSPVVSQNGGVVYPFSIVAPAGVDAGKLGRATLPNRLNNTTPDPWDFNQDGLAHAGMVPDLIADLRSVGVTDSYLQPLFRSAEAYVRMWESADGTAPPFEGGAVIDTGVDTLVRAASVSGTSQPMTATFSIITDPGYLVAEPMENPPPPPSTFVFLGLAFDLITTATYTGPITVCMEDSSYTSSDQLLHFESGNWVNITAAGNGNGTVCGQTSSLSPFVVARPLSNNAPSASAGTYAPFEATSPSGATVILAGSGTDADAGDTLTFAWFEGTTPLGSGASISTTLALGSHDIALIVTDSHGASASSTARIVVRDTTPPVVIAPAPLAMPATEAGGARASAWAALAAWLASATARDQVDIAPVALAAEANGAPVTPSTIFRIGATTVRFSFRDAAGNIGFATSTVTVAVGKPRFETALVGSGTLAGGRRFVDLSVKNTGTGVAQLTTMAVIALPSKGLGLVSVKTPMPVTVGTVNPGASKVVRVEMTVAVSVKEVLIVTAGAFLNVQGVPDVFSTQHVFKP